MGLFRSSASWWGKGEGEGEGERRRGGERGKEEGGRRDVYREEDVLPSLLCPCHPLPPSLFFFSLSSKETEALPGARGLLEIGSGRWGEGGGALLLYRVARGDGEERKGRPGFRF